MLKLQTENGRSHLQVPPLCACHSDRIIVVAVEHYTAPCSHFGTLRLRCTVALHCTLLRPAYSCSTHAGLMEYAETLSKSMPVAFENIETPRSSPRGRDNADITLRPWFT